MIVQNSTINIYKKLIFIELKKYILCQTKKINIYKKENIFMLIKNMNIKSLTFFHQMEKTNIFPLNENKIFFR